VKTFKKAIVVGASSGIGEAIAVELSRSGATVTLVARRDEELQRVRDRIQSAGGQAHINVHDVTQFDEVPALFDSIVTAMDGVDIVIYVAGVMPSIEEHEYAFEKDRFMVDVNLLGAMAWFNPAAAHMEAQRHGVLVGISSVAGERGRRQNPGYCTSKAALTTYLESLRNRLHRYGVDVVTVKPGFVATQMTDGLEKTPFITTPQDVAMRTVAAARRGPKTIYTRRIWGLVMFVIRQIPSVVFRKLNI
jgi:short-subunit dehydrogenase